MKIKDKFADAILVPLENKGFYINWDKVDKIEHIADEFAISFYNWMRKNDTQENSDKYFHYTDKDMLNAFKEETGL